LSLKKQTRLRNGRAAETEGDAKKKKKRPGGESEGKEAEREGKPAEDQVEERRNDVGMGNVVTRSGAGRPWRKKRKDAGGAPGPEEEYEEHTRHNGRARQAETKKRLAQRNEEKQHERKGGSKLPVRAQSREWSEERRKPRWGRRRPRGSLKKNAGLTNVERKGGAGKEPKKAGEKKVGRSECRGKQKKVTTQQN